jgi:hypothetical protein
MAKTMQSLTRRAAIAFARRFRDARLVPPHSVELVSGDSSPIARLGIVCLVFAYR